MQRFKNILVVVDASTDTVDSPALQQAIALAQRNHAKLTLMDTVVTPDKMLQEYKGILKVADITALFIEQCTQALSTITAKIPDTIDTEVKVATGKDFIEIIRQLLSGHHDLLIKGIDSSDKTFGNTDFHLMRKSPVPVWLIKNDQQHQLHKLLATIDLNLETTSEGRQINRLIMDLSTSLAKHTKCECHWLACWSIYGESALRDSSFMRVSEAEFAAIYQQQEQQQRDMLEQLRKQYAAFDITTHLVKAEAKEYIPQFVNEHAIDLVVMGTVARTGIPGFFIGNTAETVLQKINSSVLTVKPESFVSPVK